MEIKAKVKNNIVIFDLFGSIDINSANFVEAVGQCVRDGYTDILCNFEGVENIDYMGISVIAIALKEIINCNGRMKFMNMPVHLKNIFSVTGLDRQVEIHNDENAALKSFKEDKVIENIKKLQMRRRFKRLPFDIKVGLRRRYENTDFYLSADILNLSAIGAYIYGCAQFKLGDEVILRFKTPQKLEGLEVEAKVVWLCDRQIQSQLYPGMGVAFYDIPCSVQEKLLEYIDKNLSLMPPNE